MQLRHTLYGLAFICAAIALGLTLAHVLEIPGKRQLSGEEWLQIQQTFYLGYAIVGAIAEVGGLLASFGIVATERRERVSTFWPVISAIGFAGMLGTYWLRNRPLNDRIASWSAQALPADWSVVRDRWDMAHSISTIFAAVAFGSLLTGFMAMRGGRNQREPAAPTCPGSRLQFDQS